MPKYLQYDLEIVPIRCKYLQKQDLVNQAIKYLDEILELNNDGELIIIDNIPFFIILGILSLFGDKYEYIKSLRTILAKFIIPSIMSYSTGNIFAKKYGGIVSVVVLATTFHSYKFLLYRLLHTDNQIHFQN